MYWGGGGGDVWETLQFYVDLCYIVNCISVKGFVLSKGSWCFPKGVGAFQKELLLSKASWHFPEGISAFQRELMLCKGSWCFPKGVGAFQRELVWHDENCSVVIFSDPTIVIMSNFEWWYHSLSLYHVWWRWPYFKVAVNSFNWKFYAFIKF